MHWHHDHCQWHCSEHKAHADRSESIDECEHLCRAVAAGPVHLDGEWCASDERRIEHCHQCCLWNEWQRFFNGWSLVHGECWEQFSLLDNAKQLFFFRCDDVDVCGTVAYGELWPKPLLWWSHHLVVWNVSEYDLLHIMHHDVKFSEHLFSRRCSRDHFSRDDDDDVFCSGKRALWGILFFSRREQRDHRLNIYHVWSNGKYLLAE